MQHRRLLLLLVCLLPAMRLVAQGTSTGTPALVTGSDAPAGVYTVVGGMGYTGKLDISPKANAGKGVFDLAWKLTNETDFYYGLGLYDQNLLVAAWSTESAPLSTAFLQFVPGPSKITAFGGKYVNPKGELCEMRIKDYHSQQPAGSYAYEIINSKGQTTKGQVEIAERGDVLYAIFTPKSSGSDSYALYAIGLTDNNLLAFACTYHPPNMKVWQPSADLSAPFTTVPYGLIVYDFDNVTVTAKSNATAVSETYNGVWVYNGGDVLNTENLTK